MRDHLGGMPCRSTISLGGREDTESAESEVGVSLEEGWEQSLGAGHETPGELVGGLRLAWLGAEPVVGDRRVTLVYEVKPDSRDACLRHRREGPPGRVVW